MYGDVDHVNEYVANSFPHADMIIKEHEDEVDDRANVEEDITEESALVHNAIRGDSNQSSNHGGDKHSSTSVCSNTNLGHTSHDGHNQREYIRSTVTKSKESHSYQSHQISKHCSIPAMLGGICSLSTMDSITTQK